MPVLTLTPRQNDPTIIYGNPPPSYYPDAVVYSSPSTNATTIVGIILAVLLAFLIGVVIWWLVRRARTGRVGGVQSGGGNGQSTFRKMFRRGRKESGAAGPSAEVYSMTVV